MKKTIKVALWVVAALALLLAAVVLAMPFWLGPTVRGVANSVVPGMTGCEFRLEQCDINPYSGKISLGGLSLKNPKGFDTPDAVSFESLKVELSFASLLSDKIHVYDITLDKPFVSYVFDGNGTNNFARIAEYVASKSDSSKKKEEKTAKDDKPGPRVLIDRLCINGTKVKYRMVTLPIPVPTFTKIGYGSDGEQKESAAEAKGATFEETGDLVWNSVKDKFVSVGGAVGAVGDAAAGAVKGVGDAAAGVLKGAAGTVGVGEGSAVGGAATKAADATKNAAAATVDSASKAVGATTDAVKDGAKAVGEGLKKLNPFGK
jgi:hypothetical protein